MYHIVPTSTLILLPAIGVVIGFMIGYTVVRAMNKSTISLLSPEGTIRLPSQEGILEDWYRRQVAKYEEARVASGEIYGSLRYFMRQNDIALKSIPKAVMEKFLISKGHPVNYKNGYLEFEGIRHVMWGDVSTGNYGT